MKTLLGLAILCLAAPMLAAPPPLPAPSSNGITVTGWVQVTPSDGAGVPRLLDATIQTSAIFRAGGSPSISPVVRSIKVRILLPASYATAPSQPYPVLYLLHGGAGSYTSWTGDGQIKTIVAGSPFRGIVVMPEGGQAGWYSDWKGQTDGNFWPDWETFHVHQLVPWIDANFNTVRNRSGRAVAGLSMGGLGALMYAGRFPATFGAVGTFSGGTDLTEPGAQTIVANSMWQVGATILWDGFFDGKYRVSCDTLCRMRTVFGPEGASGRWDAKNPYQLAAAYEAYEGRMAVYTGGIPSGETDIGGFNAKFHTRLNEVGVGHRYCAGAGTHSWSYWREDLKDFLRYIHGTPSAACPNGWGAPRP
jgi:S-formylglutathione hydrolase FrmB